MLKEERKKTRQEFKDKSLAKKAGNRRENSVNQRSEEHKIFKKIKILVRVVELVDTQA